MRSCVCNYKIDAHFTGQIFEPHIEKTTPSHQDDNSPVLRVYHLFSIFGAHCISFHSCYCWSTAELKEKIGNLTKTYNDVKQATEKRNSALKQTLDVSEDFWSGLDEVKEKLSDVKGTLDVQDKPALDPETIKRQQMELEVRVRQSEVFQCRN